MTLHINLPPEMETFLSRKVSTGFYGNATEVISDALQRMQAEEAREAVERERKREQRQEALKRILANRATAPVVTDDQIEAARHEGRR